MNLPDGYMTIEADVIRSVVLLDKRATLAGLRWQKHPSYHLPFPLRDGRIPHGFD